MSLKSIFISIGAGAGLIGAALGIKMMSEGPQTVNVKQTVDIKWTDDGVPHITAQAYEGLGYGYGYVLAQDRLCALADHVIGLRGERSKWYGPDAPALIGFLPANNLTSDLFYKIQLSDDLVAQAMSKLETDTRDLTKGFVDGLNHYVGAQPDATCGGSPVPVFEVEDIARVLMSIGNTGKAFHVGPALIASGTAWGRDESVSEGVSDVPAITLADFNHRKLGFGSNAWVYGGDIAEGDGAIVVGNPHSSWADQWLSMHQAHWTIPGEIDVAGATFLGLPLPQTGFNKDVAWSILQASTVTWQLLQHMQVDEATASYMMDGESRPLQIQPVVVDVLGSDGAVSEKQFQLAYSELGPIYRLPAAPGRPAGWYAVADIGDGNARGLDQFLQLSKAGNVGEFVTAVENNRGLGSHLVAGDRHGDTAFVEAGPLFAITDEQLASCHYKGGDTDAAFIVLDGSRSACSIRGKDGLPLVADSAHYPTILTRGILQNVNNSYKTAEYGKTQPDYSILLGNTNEAEFNLRMFMSERQMKEVNADGKVTAEESLDVIFDNRNTAAELWLDTILSLCSDAGTEDAKEGCTVLATWDRKNNADSRGALLFHQFWNKKVYALDGIFPAHNPSDLFADIPLNLSADQKATLLAGLAETVAELKSMGYAPNAEWGTAFYADTPSGRVTLNGGSGVQGILNVEEVLPLTPKGFAGIMYGTAYLQRVTWENGKLAADVLLAHGQHGSEAAVKAKQLQLFSDKTLYRFPFSAEELSRATVTKSLTLVKE